MNIDETNFTQEDFNYITQLPEILNDSGAQIFLAGGIFELGNLNITITALDDSVNDLIKL